MSYSFRIGDLESLDSNIGVVDSRSVYFLSAFCYSKLIVKSVEKAVLKSHKDMVFQYCYYKTEPDAYKVISNKIPNSDFYHIIIYKKDKIYKDLNDNEHLRLFIYLNINKNLLNRYPDQKSCASREIQTSYPTDLLDTLFDKLYANSPVPMLRQWTSYVFSQLIAGDFVKCLRTYQYDEAEPNQMLVYAIDVSVPELIEIISNGLKNNRIFINEAEQEPSESMASIYGLDAYLNTYSEVLAKRIQQSFTPRFVPQSDSYSKTLKNFIDYVSYRRGIDLYPAQKDVIQATANCLDYQKAAFIIGSCGSGKTLMGIGSVLAHNRDKKKMLNVVMCPAHLVKKWKHEITKVAPLSDAYIIDSFSSLLKVMPLLTSTKKRRRHIWLVLSKETAKFGYEKRPSAVWNKAKNCFCCPTCGKPLFKWVYAGKGRNRYRVPCYLKEEDFLKPSADNKVCINKVKKWNYKTEEYEEVFCKTPLWEPVNRENDKSKRWAKLGKAGWVLEELIGPMEEDLSLRSSLKKEERSLLKALNDALDNGVPPQRAPRKYPIAKYIRRYLKNKIDYFIADEIHQLKAGDSAQGEAFGDLVFAAKKTIGLTGTLLNGYASGVFYILYRTFAKSMKKSGFNYRDEDKFTKEYGVVQKTSRYKYENGVQKSKFGTSKIKALPGVSPLIFSKFLLENATFISQEDISTGLPGYTEIPIGVEMDNDLRGAYSQFEMDIRKCMGGWQKNVKIMGQVIQSLSVYPDQPYGQPPIVHPDSGKVIAEPIELSDELRNKEARFLEIVQERLAAGEKVLVYYHWTKRTNLSDRLPKLLEDNGIKAAVLTSSIKASEREEWIRDKLNKGTQVLLCNPTLVETGLDLLDFTTIIYYQMGYNLYTMRQASRRSWRLSQTKDVTVYFLYYKGTIQEQALSLMASKLQASMAIEGKFSEEGLNAMSNTEDIFTQIAASVSEGIRQTVDVQVFQKISVASTQEKKEDENTVREEIVIKPYSMIDTSKLFNSKSLLNKEAKNILNKPALIAGIC